MRRADARRLWQRYRIRTAEVTAHQNYCPPAVKVLHGAVEEAFVEATSGRAKAVIQVDPGCLVAFQFFVCTGLVGGSGSGDIPWAERCLPVTRPRAAVPVRRDGNSLLSEVPHAEHYLMLTASGELKVEQTPPYVMVGDLGGGRLLLRAGYHRAYDYLRAGPVPDQPFLAALTGEPWIELEAPGRRSKLAAPTPPLVADFFDPELSLKVKMRRVRFRFRITAELETLAGGGACEAEIGPRG